ncbi:MAG: hydrogenase expression/formation protein HypE [Abditibacteriales bacterium]|nr:hydrogenase expression/formation protein HypE [Abditibacteriales bacterium]
MDNFSCPIPIAEYPTILLAHGGGGKLMHQLIERIFVPTFGNPTLNVRHDAAVLGVNGVRLAFTTDSFVVRPLFFPGGDIGSLAVHGTVNDLAMCGARPLYLSAGFILEEGLPMETLWRIVRSMQAAAQSAGVEIVTGDTKVVDKGKGDGVFINTSGVGVIEHSHCIAPDRVRPGDVLLVNGDLGRHGIAIMAVREGLEFESAIESDSAPVAGLVLELLSAGIDIHCLRDLTRGGLASALNEIAAAARVGITIDEKLIPVREDVQAACEMLGFDPLYVANEGRFVAFVAPSDAERALDLMRAHPLGEGASIIGAVSDEDAPLVTLTSRIGARRIVDMLSGEQLPRIC